MNHAIHLFEYDSRFDAFGGVIFLSNILLPLPGNHDTLVWHSSVSNLLFCCNSTSFVSRLQNLLLKCHLIRKILPFMYSPTNQKRCANYIDSCESFQSLLRNSRGRSSIVLWCWKSYTVRTLDNFNRRWFISMAQVRETSLSLKKFQ